MKSKKILIIGNWKMNPNSLDKAKALFQEIRIAIKSFKKLQIIICPPFVYLNDLLKLVDKNIDVGAQDVFWEKAGPFTGEISSDMLPKGGYVILGHSERRELGETDEVVAKKILSALKAKLRPILCVGEKVRDDHGEYLHFLRKQIVNSLNKIPKTLLNKIIIAYEPVWAVGQEEAMKPADIHQMTIFIKKVLVEMYGAKIKINVSVLYGGSVDHNNALDIIQKGEVQGLLIGRESLNPKKFAELLKNVSNI